MRLDPEILDRPPDEGARVVALALCAAAEEAAGRLGEDAEALHDFRVAVRRLRSALRAFRGLLRGAVDRAQERRLRDLTRATGPARDAEVLLAWLRAQRGELPDPYRGALDWLGERVERARHDGEALVTGEVAPLFRELAPDLVRSLAAGGALPAAAGTPEGFGAALAGLARAQARRLREALAAVVTSADVAHAHRARIEAKRLRYLLEPLRDNARADAAPAVSGLKRLQEVLGELHDAHVAGVEAAAALVVEAAERARRPAAERRGAGARPGLLALEQRARQRAEDCFARLGEDWLAGGATEVLDRVFEVVAALELADAEEVAPERRLLLAGLPEEARGEVEELEQGWLPGDRLRESFGVVRAPAGQRHFRAVAQGRGARRVEAVEEVAREDFEAYWPLTEGRRVQKRRHRPPGGGWCFDEYLDRRLVLAVAVEGGGAEVPAWLEPLVVRDVTGERGYQDEALARRHGRG